MNKPRLSMRRALRIATPLLTCALELVHAEALPPSPVPSAPAGPVTQPVEVKRADAGRLPPSPPFPPQPSRVNPRTGVVNQQPIPLSLYAGQVRVVEQSGVERVAIGNGGLLTASVVADKQIVLLGERAGTTSLYVWLRNGTQLNYEVTVSGDNIAKTAHELRQLLANDSGVTVNAVGDRVVMDGTYANPDTAEKLAKISKAYPQVLNLIRDRPEDKPVQPDQMVQLDVKVVEVRKQALDNIGVNWNNLNVTGPIFATSGYFYANSSFRAGLSQGAQQFPATNAARPFVSYLGLATQVTSVLNFLESNGDSWTLAEPRISSVSGGSSKVQVGGEIPIPVSSGFGQITVVYKPYGVILEFKPVIDRAGNVRSTIMAEVSAPDRTNGTGDFVAFTMNHTETEVSLKQNETLVISGLLKTLGARTKQGIPGLGRAPLVGSLFSSQETSNETTEMLVVVTPRVHTPAAVQAEVLASESAYQSANAVKALIDQKLAR